jgi:hypothetical protein
MTTWLLEVGMPRRAILDPAQLVRRACVTGWWPVGTSGCQSRSQLPAGAVKGSLLAQAGPAGVRPVPSLAWLSPWWSCRSP